MRVIQIVPDAVKTAHNCCFGRHESVAHPYCKDSVLLTEGLAGGDFADVAGGDPSLTFRMTGKVGRDATRTVAATDIAAEGELQDTA